MKTLLVAGSRLNDAVYNTCSRHQIYIGELVMLRKILISCGIVAPVLYVIAAVVGAAIRPDYSQIVNAISELI